MKHMLVLAMLGAAAGLITTLSGFGGGLFLVTCLALLWDPLSALTISSLALLGGNAHRLYLYRRHLDWSFAMPVIFGVMPGALGGALLATSMPSWLLQLAILAATLAALLHILVKRTAILPASYLAPGASAVGFLSATTGGGGFLLGPLLLSAGARGSRYIAIGASAGVAVHCLRIVGYSTTGLLDFEFLAQAVLLSGSIMVGNLLGRWIRHRAGEQRMRWLEVGAPALCAALALAGI